MTDTPTTQERYASATQSSSLRVEAGLQGDADYLIAAGWSKSRFGAALMRLHSEWDAAARRGCQIPRQATRKQIAQLARDIATAKQSKQVEKEHSDAARKRLEDGFVSELKETMRMLKMLPEVRLHLQLTAALDQCPETESVCCAVLLHWLKPVCAACSGRKFQLSPRAGELSSVACRFCGGSGHGKVPGGEHGRKLLTYMEDCVGRARQGIRSRLHGKA
ncbi:hypothetical protein COAQ111491_21505 [Comamonas aquatilis]|uniref:hypothetical protein n=1 Tax=Comamonas aquatilis TaxID=1778406 RepID=UPI0039EE9ACD